MAKIYGTPLMMGGGGGQNLTLPPMVTNLTAKGSNATITVSWTNPESDALSGIAVVYNSTHTPDKPSDGTKVDAGLSETASLTGLENGTLYYIRVFPYNAKKQYQTLLNGATTSATPNIGPAQVTNFKVTGSGANPVLTWENPKSDPLYSVTVVIQKEGSAPSGLSDGTEIFRGTNETCTASGLAQSTDYYFAVFTLSSDGGTRGPVVSDVYRYDFPAEPTEWSEVTRLTNSQEYTFPETGWFKIIAVAGSGNGYEKDTMNYEESPDNYSYIVAGGSGGSGGISVSKISTQNIKSIQINISGYKNISIPALSMTANAGGNATARSPGNRFSYGGAPGNASGGNVSNIPGKTGNTGGSTKYTGTGNEYARGGNSVSTSYEGYSTISGKGAGGKMYDMPSSEQPGAGSNAYVVILRGNTNEPSPSQASTLSLLPTDSTLTVDWTNSGDPVQTGTMLVYNTNHVPTSANDGVSVDMPVTQATAATFAVDGEEQQADSKKQSYTITGLTNNKPVYVALFPYDANKKYGIPKTDVEIPRVHSWYDTQQELKQDVEEAQQQAEEANEKVEAAEEQVKQATAQAEEAEAKAQEATEQAVQAQSVVLMTCNYLPDAVALIIPSIYPEWDANSVTYTGKDKATESDPADIVRYQDLLYRCIQSHTSQEGWNPKDAVSLWVRIADPAEEYPEWIQPAGAHDAYEKGAKVTHNGKKWTSDIAANVWEPGVYGWTEVIE